MMTIWPSSTSKIRLRNQNLVSCSADSSQPSNLLKDIVKTHLICSCDTSQNSLLMPLHRVPVPLPEFQGLLLRWALPSALRLHLPLSVYLPGPPKAPLSHFLPSPNSFLMTSPLNSFCLEQLHSS